MTNIDFYILQDAASEARWHFVCRLIDKAARAGHKVLVAMDDPEDAKQLDELLWTFKPESFIPHQLLPASAGSNSPVEILSGNLAELPTHHHGLLINLSHTIPAAFSQFERLSEVVIQEPTVLKNTRDHYSFYRKRGYPIQHRKM